MDDGAGGLTALHVEAGPPDRARIEGPVDSVGSFSGGVGSFSIHGVAVSVVAGTTDCEDANDVTIPCEDFFTDLVVGNKVKATDRTFPYDFADPADEVAFED